MPAEKVESLHDALEHGLSIAMVVQFTATPTGTLFPPVAQRRTAKKPGRYFHQTTLFTLMTLIS